MKSWKTAGLFERHDPIFIVSSSGNKGSPPLMSLKDTNQIINTSQVELEDTS